MVCGRFAPAGMSDDSVLRLFKFSHGCTLHVQANRPGQHGTVSWGPRNYHLREWYTRVLEFLFAVPRLSSTTGAVSPGHVEIQR